MRHNRSEFFNKAFRLDNIDNYKASQMSQGKDCLRNFSITRWVEIEEYWQVVSLAKFLPDGIRDFLTLRCKATKNKYDFVRNGVNDTTHVFIGQQKVDELGHIKVIHSDSRFILLCNNEVCLGCVLQLDIPYKDPMDSTT